MPVGGQAERTLWRVTPESRTPGLTVLPADGGQGSVLGSSMRLGLISFSAVFGAEESPSGPAGTVHLERPAPSSPPGPAARTRLPQLWRLETVLHFLTQIRAVPVLREVSACKVGISEAVHAEPSLTHVRHQLGTKQCARGG